LLLAARVLRVLRCCPMAAVSSSSRSRSRSRSRSNCQQGEASSADKLVEAIIQLLEAGTTPWRRQWDASGGGHHVNLLNGHRYRGANVILLTLGMHLRGSALPYWCGFAEARAQGILPRKGSQGVRILRPQVNRVTGTEGSDRSDTPAGTPVSKPDDAPTDRVSMSFRPVVVFNAFDLEGDALEGWVAQRQAEAAGAERSEPERLATAEALLGAWPVPVSYGGERACYLPPIDRIQLPERAAFHSAAGFYATWAHEVIHSTGHASRLQRDLSGRFGSRAYAREELVAELGSVLLGDQLEIGSALENHAAYLGHWVELLKVTPQVLYQVLGEVRLGVELVLPES
jgi:antirestriction protein ArdC